MPRILRRAAVSLCVAIVAASLLAIPVFAADPAAPIAPTPETNAIGVVDWESVAGAFGRYEDARAKLVQLHRRGIDGYEIEAEGRAGNLRFEVEKEFDTFNEALRAVERLWHNGLRGWVEAS
jgi:hypothetical protein